jgi:hypothetical protein
VKAPHSVADDLIENTLGCDPVAWEFVHLPLDGDVFPSPPIGVTPQFADRRRWKFGKSVIRETVLNRGDSGEEHQCRDHAGDPGVKHRA